jgi:hypothetical protein
MCIHGHVLDNKPHMAQQSITITRQLQDEVAASAQRTLAAHFLGQLHTSSQHAEATIRACVSGPAEQHGGLLVHASLHTRCARMLVLPGI